MSDIVVTCTLVCTKQHSSVPFPMQPSFWAVWGLTEVSYTYVNGDVIFMGRICLEFVSVCRYLLQVDSRRCNHQMNCTIPFVLPCFWQITQANVVKLCSRLAARDRPLVFTRGFCWIKHETVVLHLDGQPLGQV